MARVPGGTAQGQRQSLTPVPARGGRCDPRGEAGHRPCPATAIGDRAGSRRGVPSGLRAPGRTGRARRRLPARTVRCSPGRGGGPARDLLCGLTSPCPSHQPCGGGSRRHGRSTQPTLLPTLAQNDLRSVNAHLCLWREVPVCGPQLPWRWPPGLHGDRNAWVRPRAGCMQTESRLEPCLGGRLHLPTSPWVGAARRIPESLGPGPGHCRGHTGRGDTVLARSLCLSTGPCASVAPGHPVCAPIGCPSRGVHSQGRAAAGHLPPEGEELPGFRAGTGQRAGTTSGSCRWTEMSFHVVRPPEGLSVMLLPGLPAVGAAGFIVSNGGAPAWAHE